MNDAEPARPVNPSEPARPARPARSAGPTGREASGDAGAARAVDSALAAARGRLDELVTLAAGAEDSVEKARDLIAEPEGLVTFADPDVLDQAGAGLRPWLEDLAAAALTGGREADVVGGLQRWHTLADETEQVAKAVARTNALPLDQRRELRGRLEAAHAKAARLGLAEDEELSALHARAFGTLYRAPSDLAVAERLTMAYLHALADHEDGADRTHRGLP